MTIISRDLPFFVTTTTVVFQGHHVSIKADQIIVWVGLTERGQTEYDPAYPFFPAILDTGHTHNFSIREDHLVRWAGLDPRYLSKYGAVRVSGDHVPSYHADIWLRPNAQGRA